MANHIASVKVLDDILDKRYHSTPKGKVQIGKFWSILQIYHCVKVIGVSPRVMCSIASMVDGRTDHNYEPTDSPIREQTLRRWLRLQALPKNVGHSTITKTVASGYAPLDGIKEVLMRNNSFGDSIMDELQEVIESSKGHLLSSTSSTQGVSDFNAVLALSLAIIDAHRDGVLDLENVPATETEGTILKALNNNNNKKNELQRIGIRL